MGFIVHSFQLLSLYFLIISFCVSAFKIPRLGISQRRQPQTESSSQFPEDLETFYYTQRLDHFNYRPDSYTTFKQRYFINFKYWGGAKSNSPIFAYLGAEEAVDSDIYNIGFLRDHAPQFNALIVYIEHRYYGKSVPFGSMKEAMRNASTRGYFNSAQALADYAAVLLHIKESLSAHYSPIIVIGASYGGMLASWFRLKYPHVALGALASSAPILYFSGIPLPRQGYYYIVTKSFRETSESCYQTIRKSWTEIDKVANKPNGLSILSKRFKTCKKLSKIFDLKDYLDSIYAGAAQYNHPPDYPLKMLCKAIDSAAKKTDNLGQIFEGVVEVKGKQTCYDMYEYSQPSGWDWQTCSEIITPAGHDYWNDSMFQTDPFNMTKHSKDCKDRYDVLPQPYWVSTYYGGADVELVLHRFASNIIFSNGLKDPYSPGGVLESISDSIIAVSTVNGSHALDLTGKDSSDPKWLVEQRNTEVVIIKGWINQYQADLLKFKIK